MHLPRSQNNSTVHTDSNSSCCTPESNLANSTVNNLGQKYHVDFKQVQAHRQKNEERWGSLYQPRRNPVVRSSAPWNNMPHLQEMQWNIWILHQQFWNIFLKKQTENPGPNISGWEWGEQPGCQTEEEPHHDQKWMIFFKEVITTASWNSCQTG